MANQSSTGTAQLPIPPPPPGGWSGKCKTVINPTSTSGAKLSVLATADEVSKKLDVSKDQEALKKKKEEKKARQKANKLVLTQQPTQSESCKPQDKSDKPQDVKMHDGEQQDVKMHDGEDEPEAVPQGKLPGSSRGGTCGTVDGEYVAAEEKPTRVNWADASSEQVDAQLKKSKYKCKGYGCEKDLFASQLMLMEPDDWCGDLTTYCFGCSGWANTEKSFMKEAKRRWTAYAYQHADKARRLRTLNFEDIEAYYELKMPGLHKAEKRKIVVAHLRLVATVITADIAKESIFTQKARLMVYEEYMLAVQHSGENPFELPEHKSWSVSAHDAQRLTRVTKHCVVSFICRDCGYYGPDWAEAIGKLWFRCYNCGTHYQPAAGGEQKSHYNNIIALQDPISKQVKHLPAYLPAWLAVSIYGG